VSRRQQQQEDSNHPMVETEFNLFIFLFYLFSTPAKVFWLENLKTVSNLLGSIIDI